MGTDHQAIAIVGMLLLAPLAIAGLLRPFFGLLALITIYFVQPGELFPALAALHIERTYALALLAAFFMQRESADDRSMLHPIVRAGVAMVGVCLLSVPFAIWKGGALDSTVNLAKLIIYTFLLSTLIDSQDRMRKVLWVLVGMLAWVTGYGFISYLQGDYIVRQGIDRAEGGTSIVGGPNELAGIILLLLPLVVALWRCTERVLLRLLLLGVMLCSLATMVVTGSRAGFIGLGLVTLYYILHSRHKAAGLAVCVSAAVILWLAMPQQYQNRYLTTVHYAQGDQLDGSNELRVQLWKAGWRMFLDHPILGVGAGQYSTAYGMQYSGRAHGAWMNPHSLFFQVASELGLVGLVAVGYFIYLLVKTDRFLLRFYSESPEHIEHQIALALGACLLSVGLNSIFGHSLYRPQWYFTAGLLAASCRLAEAIPQAVNSSAEQVTSGLGLPTLAS